MSSAKTAPGAGQRQFRQAEGNAHVAQGALRRGIHDGNGRGGGRGKRRKLRGECPDQGQCPDAPDGCAVADDSGLEVDALCGRPGVHSARYAGVHGDDEANIACSSTRWRKRKSAPPVTSAPWPWCARSRAHPCPGRLRGTDPAGIPGQRRFGYDPLFLSEDLGVTFAQAQLADKNRISHRARAIRLLLDALKEK